ncbi:RICIN domain-containing protein [Streptomyces sp. NPDC093249]|uniref:RICIN domain-containing protein n=1 Tax=unclassified Streptomyces TaxID=2593676 RepID=UPI00344D6DE0
MARGGLALLALAALGLGAAPSAGAAPGKSTAAPQRAAAGPAVPQDRGFYTIRAVHSGKCIGPYGDNLSRAVQLVQQPCDGRLAQVVRLNSLGEHRSGTGDWETYYSVQSPYGYCWASSSWIDGLVTRPLHERATLEACNSLTWKHVAFTFRGNPSSGYHMADFTSWTDGQSGTCLGVDGQNMNDNAGVIYWHCGDQGQNMKFQLIPV